MMIQTGESLKVLRLSHAKINRRGLDEISNSLQFTPHLTQIQVHGNIAPNQSFGDMLVSASHHHTFIQSSKLEFSFGGCEVPNETPIYPSEIKSQIASMNRNSKVRTIMLRRRGNHMLKNRQKATRLSIYIDKLVAPKRLTVLRVRLANIISINAIDIHVASSQR